MRFNSGFKGLIAKHFFQHCWNAVIGLPSWFYKKVLILHSESVETWCKTAGQVAVRLQTSSKASVITEFHVLVLRYVWVILCRCGTAGTRDVFHSRLALDANYPVSFMVRTPNANCFTVILRENRNTFVDFIEFNSSQSSFYSFVLKLEIDYWMTAWCKLMCDMKIIHRDPARKLSANLYDIHHCCAYSEKLLMMDRGTVRNM